MDLKIAAVASGVVEAERGEHRSSKYYFGEAVPKDVRTRGTVIP